MSRILVVDDEPTIGWGLREYFRDLKHDVRLAGSVEAALDAAGAFQPEAILVDVRLPGRDGLSAIPEFRANWGPIPVIVMTAFGDLETAVRAVQQGAFDYLTKPFDLETAGAVVDRALTVHPLPATAETKVAHLTQASLLGTSAAMQEVFKQIALAAPTEVPILITGETGTGKELAAQAIHRHSARADGPFVPVCLAALSSSVVESELFGHVRGAFTGAVDDRSGLIELANGGTLFLDEIGDTPLSLQVKLLRFLETRQYSRVGSGQLRTANVRVVAATHRRLTELIARGVFREDLMFRLRGFELTMPALRERRGDIPLLADAFAAQACPRSGRLGLTEEFYQELQRRMWAGNVRELRSAIEHAAILARGGLLAPQHLPPELPSTSGPAARDALDVQSAVSVFVQTRLAQLEDPSAAADLYRDVLAVMEPGLFKEVLERCGGNRAAAARLLGLDRTTLRSKLRVYGLDPDGR